MNELVDPQRSSDPRIEAGLAELLGGEHAPDVAAAVVRRWQHERDAGRRGSRSKLLIAAVLLLGLGAVAGTAWMAGRATDLPDTPATQEPTFVVVRSAADVRVLAADVRAIEGHDLPTDAIAAIAARPQTTALRLRYGAQTQEYAGGLSIHQDEKNRRSVDDAALLPLARLSALQQFELAGARNVEGSFLAALAGRQHLRQLALVSCDIADEHLRHLVDLPALDDLVVQGNLRLTGRGIATITACARIDELDLLGCPLLTGQDLAQIAAMTQLRHLRLRNVSLVRGDDAAPTAAEAAAFAAAEAASQRPDAGVTDATVLALARLRLQFLDLDWSKVGDVGVAGLAAMDSLLSLSLQGTQVTTAGVRRLPRSLLVLHLQQCPALDAGTIDALAGMSLEALSLPQQSWLTDALLRQLLRQQPLHRYLDISGSTGLTAANREMLLAAAVRDLDVTGVAGWRGNDPAIEAERRKGRRIVYRVW